VLSGLLERIALDESRHFFFYYRQAERRMQQRAVARVARLIVDRFWAPVGTGVQPGAEGRIHGTIPLRRRRGSRGGPQGRRRDSRLPGCHRPTARGMD